MRIASPASLKNFADRRNISSGVATGVSASSSVSTPPAAALSRLPDPQTVVLAREKLRHHFRAASPPPGRRPRSRSRHSLLEEDVDGRQDECWACFPASSTAECPVVFVIIQAWAIFVLPTTSHLLSRRAHFMLAVDNYYETQSGHGTYPEIQKMWTTTSIPRDFQIAPSAPAGRERGGNAAVGRQDHCRVDYLASTGLHHSNPK